MSTVKGYVHSFQSLGTLDGPGVRFVVFLQGCNLRCGCCHNPDTWNMLSGELYSPEEIIEKVCRYREYFGADGGITLSGGEPILQPEFAYEVFALCHEKGINTCLDTSGSILNDDIKILLTKTDRVLLDIKYTSEEQYLDFVGCTIDAPLKFLSYLDEKQINTTLRQVIIPSLNDNSDNILKLKELAEKHSCVDRVELLPFKKICQVKYDNLNIDFSFAHISVPTKEKMNELNKVLGKYSK